MAQEFGARLFIDDMGGSGDLLLFVHGLGGTSNTFAPQGAALKHEHHVVGYDLAGAGRSPVPDSLTIERHVEDLEAIASRFGAERFHLAGHSMGTIICQHFAASRPGRVASLVLFGAFPEPPPAARDALRGRAENARANGMRPIADAIVANGIAEDVRVNQPAAAAFVRESLMAQPAEGYARNCEALAAARATDLGQIRCPTLLVTGDADKTGPVDGARAMASALGEAELVVVAGCGHWPTIERAKQSSYAAAKFYATLRQRARIGGRVA
jgi:3-oxoadipate enol-lactonase